MEKRRRRSRRRVCHNPPIESLGRRPERRLCYNRRVNARVILEELSEEDQQLKSELEMLVERLKV
jgi:hypothetical protein